MQYDLLWIIIPIWVTLGLSHVKPKKKLKEKQSLHEG